jgi:hypothetical protein
MRDQIRPPDQGTPAANDSAARFCAEWRSAYGAFLDRVPAFVDAASLTLCGMGACVDACVAMHDMDGLLAARAPAEATALAALLKDRAARGIGGEIWVDWAGGPAWLARHVPVRYALGGTGPQAGWALTVAGAPALVALEDRSAHMMARLDSRLLLAEAGAMLPAAQVAPRGEPRAEIYIFEYTAGIPCGDVLPPRSSRIIVRFSNHGLEHDPEFDRLSVRVAGTAGAALVSGFSNVPAGLLAAEMARVSALALAWRAAGVGTVHLELAGYDTRETGERVFDGLHRAITSVGMSHSEFLTLNPGQPLAAGMCALGDRLGIARVCVHADDWAAAATKGDPEVECQALMMGCLLSSVRAAAGQPVRPTAIDPRVRLQMPPFPRQERRRDWTLVSCPSLYLEAPATTLGLGDTFAAGCLLVLGGRASSGGRR